MALELRDALLVLLGVTGVLFVIMLVRALRAQATTGLRVWPRWPVLAISFVATFLDTLGIGSFATTTTGFRRWKLLRDEHLPGTLNIGYVVPTITQALIFTRLVPVGATTLVLMILASVAGAWLGAGVVCSWPKRRVQIGMGIALLVPATTMLLSQPQINLIPAGGSALELEGWRLAAGVAGNFVLGALMTLGIGLYAPCMILVYVLGMTPAAAFPIMMGSCAFLMPVASARFLKAGAYDRAAVVGMSLTGIPAVLLAYSFFRTLSLRAVMWLVIVVVTYTAIGLLRAAARESREPS